LKQVLREVALLLKQHFPEVKKGPRPFVLPNSVSR
jgi:hypothetical protein